MVNNTFYSTINQLTQQFTQGGDLVITDYSSFIDAGRVLADLEPEQLQNGFLAPLMNKVVATVDTFRSYDPALPDMFQGTSDFGVVEILAHTFYNARQAPFIGLVDTTDDSMIDFKKPEIEARYYTDTNAWQTYISVSDVELRGAWRSPATMDAFIQSLLGAVANSNRLHREVARINNIAGAIGHLHELEQLNNNVRVATENQTGQYIDLLAIYNSIYPDDTVTVGNALHVPQFVRWAVSYINMFKLWMEKPHDDMNAAGILTFTPRAAQRTKISTVFDSAIRRSLWDIYRTEGALLGDYEAVPYWQNTDKAQAVSVEGGAAGDYINVLAVVYDDYALQEYKDLESVSSERNNKKLYNTYYYNFAYRYIRNENANFVMFTLGSLQFS